MSRAPAMSPDERRQSIIAVTVPLLQELGVNVTTAQIAHAAGIAEGTIFRVFDDKHELLTSAARAAMSGEREIERMGAIPLDVPLPQRLGAALRVLGGYQERMVALMRLFRESGMRFDSHGPLVLVHKHAGEPPQAAAGHPAEGIVEAIARLIEPDRAQLRLEPKSAARMLLALSFSNRLHEMGLGEPGPDSDQLVDLFLNGVVKS
ncbi:MAG: TetR/AcrR family transcriptional regulator [Chloroflexi bacterium]|nr:TetR/AcrR family transcriptional regulator [Chloroflexota bacterium]